MLLYLHSILKNGSKFRFSPFSRKFSGRWGFIDFKCNVLIVFSNDSVAQLVEHYTFNVGVLGSNPSGITVFPPKTL